MWPWLLFLEIFFDGFGADSDFVDCGIQLWFCAVELIRPILDLVRLMNVDLARILRPDFTLVVWHDVSGVWC